VNCEFYMLQCDPNMAVYGVWINNLDLRLPRIALFAIKDIEKDEELTFDYMMTGTFNNFSALQQVVCCLWAAGLILCSICTMTQIIFS